MVEVDFHVYLNSGTSRAPLSMEGAHCLARMLGIGKALDCQDTLEALLRRSGKSKVANHADNLEKLSDMVPLRIQDVNFVRK